MSGRVTRVQWSPDGKEWHDLASSGSASAASFVSVDTNSSYATGTTAATMAEGLIKSFRFKFTTTTTRRAMQRAIKLLGGYHGMRREKRRARKRRGK